MQTNAETLPALPLTVNPIGQLRVQIVGPGRLQSMWTEPVDWVTAKLLVDYNNNTCPAWKATIRLNNRALHRDAETAFRMTWPKGIRIRTLTLANHLPNGEREVWLVVRYITIPHEHALPEACIAPGVVSPETQLQLSPPPEPHDKRGWFLAVILRAWCSLSNWLTGECDATFPH